MICKDPVMFYSYHSCIYDYPSYSIHSGEKHNVESWKDQTGSFKCIILTTICWFGQGEKNGFQNMSSIWTQMKSNCSFGTEEIPIWDAVVF